MFEKENYVSDDSAVLQSDVRISFKNICISNINRFMFGHVNVNSLRTKFVSEQVKDSVDILMVSETKLDDSFAEFQFLIKDFHLPSRFDHNRYFGGIMLYVREDIPSKLLNHDFSSAESFIKTCIKRNGSLTVLITSARVTLVNILISSVDR